MRRGAEGAGVRSSCSAVRNPAVEKQLPASLTFTPLRASSSEVTRAGSMTPLYEMMPVKQRAAKLQRAVGEQRRGSRGTDNTSNTTGGTHAPRENPKTYTWSPGLYTWQSHLSARQSVTSSLGDGTQRLHERATHSLAALVRASPFRMRVA